VVKWRGGQFYCRHVRLLVIKAKGKKYLVALTKRLDMMINTNSKLPVTRWKGCKKAIPRITARDSLPWQHAHHVCAPDVQLHEKEPAGLTQLLWSLGCLEGVNFVVFSKGDWIVSSSMTIYMDTPMNICIMKTTWTPTQSRIDTPSLCAKCNQPSIGINHRRTTKLHTLSAQ
jgi:hypothetical protein